MADLALVTAGTLSVEQSIIQHTLVAGVAIAAGDIVTIDPTTGKWAKADAGVGEYDMPLALAFGKTLAGLGVTGIQKGEIDGFDLSALDYGAPVFLSNTAGKLASAIGGVKEVQTLTQSGSPTGGTFKLTFRGEETAAIAYDATGAEVATALGLLASVGPGNVSGSGGASGPYVITFGGELADQAVPLITLSDNSLTGGSSPTIGIAETTAGVTSRRVGWVKPKNLQSLGTAPDKVLFLDM